jgi:hypothetical protein
LRSNERRVVYVRAAGGGGRWELVGCPLDSWVAVSARLRELGASEVGAIGSGRVRFRAKRSVVEQLCLVFPACPLACSVPAVRVLPSDLRLVA